MINFKCKSESCDTEIIYYGQYDESNIQPEGDILVPVILVCRDGHVYSYDQDITYLDIENLEEITSDQLQKVADTIHKVEDKQAEIDKLLSSLLS